MSLYLRAHAASALVALGRRASISPIPWFLSYIFVGLASPIPVPFSLPPPLSSPARLPLGRQSACPVLSCSVLFCPVLHLSNALHPPPVCRKYPHRPLQTSILGRHCQPTPTPPPPRSAYHPSPEFHIFTHTPILSLFLSSSLSPFLVRPFACPLSPARCSPGSGNS